MEGGKKLRGDGRFECSDVGICSAMEGRGFHGGIGGEDFRARRDFCRRDDRRGGTAHVGVEGGILLRVLHILHGKECGKGVWF